jgi:hypothetical protein
MTYPPLISSSFASSCRPTTFLVGEDIDNLYQLLQGAQRSDNISPAIQTLCFGIGVNSPIPAKTFFEWLREIEGLDAEVYIRCLGTKHTLSWGLGDTVQPILQQLTTNFISLTDNLNHAIDICLSVARQGAAVFISRSALREFARSLQASTRFFHILGLVQYANMQCSLPDAVRGISHINFYSSFLGAIRVGGA